MRPIISSLLFGGFALVQSQCLSPNTLDNSKLIASSTAHPLTSFPTLVPPKNTSSLSTTVSSTTANRNKSTDTQKSGLGLPLNPNAIGDCETVSTGHGPRPVPDTTFGFLTSPKFSNLARNASTPSNYTRVYSNQHASSFAANFLQYDELETYNVEKCASLCDLAEKCEAINIFFERAPAINIGPTCKTSSSSTMIKCVLWANRLDESDATNRGYLRWDFGVVIAGSNAYNKGSEVMENSTSEVKNHDIALNLMMFVTFLYFGGWYLRLLLVVVTVLIWDMGSLG